MVDKVEGLKASSRVVDTLIDDSGAAVEIESFKLEFVLQQTLGKWKPPTFSLPQIKLF